MECLDHSTVLSQPEPLDGSGEVWTTDEDVAKISPEDWKAIEGKIAKAITAAIEPLKVPKLGWRKAADTLKEYAPLGGVFAIIATLLALVGALGMGLLNRREVEATFRGKTEEKLNGIDRQLIDLRALVASNQPTRKQNQNAAKQLLEEALNKVIPQLPKSTVNQTGEAFNTAAEPDAFKVAVQYAAYRTSLNAPYLGEGWMESPPVPYPEWLRKIADASRAPGTPEPIWFTRGMAPIEQAAKFLPLGAPDPRIGKMTQDVRDERIEGGEFRIDLMDLKNQWFVNSVIHYAGSPLKTDHVTFINCTFVFEYGANSRILVGSILSEQPSLTVTIN